jgi:hypothetical protein
MSIVLEFVCRKMKNKSFGQKRMDICREGSKGQT